MAGEGGRNKVAACIASAGGAVVHAAGGGGIVLDFGRRTISRNPSAPLHE